MDGDSVPGRRRGRAGGLRTIEVHTVAAAAPLFRMLAEWQSLGPMMITSTSKYLGSDEHLLRTTPHDQQIGNQDLRALSRTYPLMQKIPLGQHY
jgi:hypothetical protein